MLLHSLVLLKLFYSNTDTEPPLKKTHLDSTELNVENQQPKHHRFVPQFIYVRLERILGLYGHFCATHAWETICTIVTLTICVVSCSLLRAIPQESQTNNNADVEENLLSLVTNCLAAVYLYTQFHQLQKLGYKFTLTIIGIFMLFASLVLTFQCLILFGYALPTCDQALPFFFFITDLGRVKQVGIYAYGARNRKEACSRVTRGISLVGPSLTLELVFLISILTLTSYSAPNIGELCLFGILWMISSYLLFITFLPAALALLFESGPTAEPFKPLDSLTRAMAGNNRVRRNFVVHRVRLIMFAGLAVIYMNNRIPFASVLSRDIPWPDAFYVVTHIVHELTHLSPQKYVALGFLLSLVFKYTMIDQQNTLCNGYPNRILLEVAKGTNSGESEEPVQNPTPAPTSTLCDASTQTAEEQEDIPVRKGMFFLSTSGSSSTEDIEQACEVAEPEETPAEPRPFSACVEIFNSDKGGPNSLSDLEIEFLVEQKYIQAYKLEEALGDPLRGVRVRRAMIERKLPDENLLQELPFEHYNYKMVMGACCENVLGYIPVPIGVSGPLLMDGISYYIPMSTTEGCLVASTNRGCRALTSAGGVKSCVTNDGMSRGPVVRFPSAVRAAEVKNWLEEEANFYKVKEWFDSTSRYARLTSLKVALAGRMLYIRFKALTGDAMGMNMLGKGTEKSLLQLNKEFTDMEILSLSGNFCVDKKPSALNWLEGRGKSVVAEATIPGKVITQVLKTSARALVELNLSKNLVGSAMAGSLGGYNAHSANVVSAIFIACGQDPAQVVGSANCMTLMETYGPTGDDLYISCTMPSLEVGTVGGGTILPAQSACLKMMGVEGPDFENSGGHARLLARLICSTVLAGELSLMSALAAGHLVKSHLRHNRSSVALNLRTVRDEPTTDNV